MQSRKQFKIIDRFCAIIIALVSHGTHTHRDMQYTQSDGSLPKMMLTTSMKIAAQHSGAHNNFDVNYQNAHT